MKFLNELAMTLILVAVMIGAVAGAVFTFAGDPGDGAGPGAFGGGCAIAFAILLHGLMLSEKPKEDTKKDSGK